MGQITPIFLISQPRAGSTMLQRILAGHPEIHTTAETWLMLHPVYALRERGHSAEFNQRLAYYALNDYLSTIQGGREVYFESLRLMAMHLYRKACEPSKANFFLDKTPRYYYIIPELAEIFPKAKFIFLLRNPLAVLNSILNTWVKGDLLRLSGAKDDLLLAPYMLDEALAFLGDDAVLVHYEQFVKDPNKQLERICGELDIDYNANMVNYGSRPSPVGRYGDRKGIHRYNSPSRDRLDRWLQLGTVKQDRYLALNYLNYLGPQLISRLGYDYSELESQLLSQRVKRGRFVVTWKTIFNENHSSIEKIYIKLIGLLQNRDFARFYKLLRGILFGRR